jgi:diguanylate cyclase (GGDEF)-like protein
MVPLAENIHGKSDKVNVLDNCFSQLINSLSGIRTISNLGNQQINQEDFIDLVMRTVIENLEAEEASLYLLQGKSLNCVASLNWEQFMDYESSINSNEISYLMSEGIIGKTATQHEVVHIRNCKISEENLIKYESNESSVGSLICAPVLANNALLGVLELSHPEPNHFKSWQEHSVVIYTDLIGLLFNNINLMSNMKEIVDERTQDLNHALLESEKLRARYEEMSVIDPLTKLYNRRFFFTEVSSGLARAKRYSQAFSLLLMDLDYFKQVNDKYGHESGDIVLTEVAKILNKFSREGDTLARIGGEEFVLALPLTDNEGAVILAERIRATIEGHAWKGNGNTMAISISIGVASLEDCLEDEDNDEGIQVSNILRNADLALYYIKQHGRNSVKSFCELPKY